jgi:hypothetical protein
LLREVYSFGIPTKHSEDEKKIEALIFSCWNLWAKECPASCKLLEASLPLDVCGQGRDETIGI